MLSSSSYEQLFAAACLYHSRGWSVIPIHGDALPDRAKVAAIQWNVFQGRRPTPDELAHWFTEKRYGGVAIVTGSVSRLVVLDFDTPDRFRAFERLYPDLAATYRVQSRRGFHAYFQLPPALRVPSRKVPGIDLLSDGRYAAAPPTVIADHTYCVVERTAPKLLQKQDAERIEAFLDAITQESVPATVPGASMCHSEASGALVTEQITAGDLVALYRHLAPRIGRNETLFRVCLRARDSGWQREAVVACLADLHAEQKANNQHRNESNAQRYREGIRTIASAFSRPARPRRDTSVYNNGQIPNSVREALFQLRQTYTVRVLEGLRLAGIQPGQTFTTAAALQKLKGKVGRDTVYHALQAITVSGEFIFPRANPTLGEPTPACADIDRDTTPTKKLLFVREQKSGKRVFHRPARRFLMPGNLELGQKLGVNPSRSDPLTEDDLRSAKHTRQAAHRELIKRRPGIYPRRWLARRLGVTTRTLHAYNQAIPIQVRPMYLSIPITWSTLNQIPSDFEQEGTFLQDEKGKRYPPKQALAARLLAKGHRLVYARRTANFYSYPVDCPADSSLPVMSRPGLFRELASSHTQLPLPEKPERLAALNHAHPRDNTLSGRAQTVSVAAPPTATGKAAPSPTSSSMSSPIQQPVGIPSKPERRSKRFFRRPLADKRHEALARQVHSETGAKGQGMSLANARRLIDTYGAQPVQTALKRMVWLQKRGKISNPAGFLVVASRIAWRIQNNAVELGAAAPRFRAEPGRRRTTPVEK